VSDIDTVVVDSLKALDPKRPIREADIEQSPWSEGLSDAPLARVIGSCLYISLQFGRASAPK
jgi:hypothetical protein